MGLGIAVQSGLLCRGPGHCRTVRLTLPWAWALPYSQAYSAVGLGTAVQSGLLCRGPGHCRTVRLTLPWAWALPYSQAYSAVGRAGRADTEREKRSPDTTPSQRRWSWLSSDQVTSYVRFTAEGTHRFILGVTFLGLAPPRAMIASWSLAQ